MQPFDARWPCPFAPLSTLRLPPHSDRRMTRGEGGRLLLPSAGLPPAVLRQLAWRTPAWSLSRPRRPFSIEVLQTMSLPPSSAPTVTGWSDSCRAGFAPAEDWRLSRRTVRRQLLWPLALPHLGMLPTALRKIVPRLQPGTGQILVTRPARVRWRGSIGGKCSGHYHVNCPGPRQRAARWISRRPPRAVWNRMSPSGIGHRSLNPNVTPPGLRPGAREGEPPARRCRSRVSVPSSVVGRGRRSAARPVGRRPAQAPRGGQRPAAPIDATPAVAAGRDPPRPTAGCGSRRRDSCPHLCQVCGRLGCYLPGIGRGAGNGN